MLWRHCVLSQMWDWDEVTDAMMDDEEHVCSFFNFHYSGADDFDLIDSGSQGQHNSQNKLCQYTFLANLVFLACCHLVRMMKISFWPLII